MLQIVHRSESRPFGIDPDLDSRIQNLQLWMRIRKLPMIYSFETVLRIRIRIWIRIRIRIHMFLGQCMDPDPDPSIIMQK